MNFKVDQTYKFDDIFQFISTQIKGYVLIDYMLEDDHYTPNGKMRIFDSLDKLKTYMFDIIANNGYTFEIEDAVYIKNMVTYGLIRESRYKYYFRVNHYYHIYNISEDESNQLIRETEEYLKKNNGKPLEY